MVEVQRKKYPLNPTLKWTDAEGRLTAEGFRIIRAIGELIENITIVDGEVTTDMIAAGAITAGKITVTSLEEISTFLGNVAIDGDLVVGGTITTGKVATNAISEITVGVQTVAAGPSGFTVVSIAVPVTSTNNTGVILTFTAITTRPTADPSNAGDWYINISRNGTLIGTSPGLFYDDNFASPVALQFVDATPGTNPTYTITTTLGSGLGNFQILGGVLNGALFKR